MNESSNSSELLGETSAQEYQTLISSFAQAFWETDAKGMVVTDSPSWRAYTGQSLEEWLGEGWASAVHPDDQQYALSQWQEAAVQLWPVDAEFRLQRPGGGWRWTNVRATPILNADGSVKKWLGINIDISKKKEFEQALTESEERFRAFVTSTSDVVYRMSADWRQMHQLVGKSFLLDTQTVNTSWLQQYIPPQEQALVQKAIDEAITEKKVFELEHEVIQADEEIGYTFSRAIPLLDEHGKIKEWFGTASDITQYKQAQQARELSEQQFRLLFDSIDEGFCIIEVLFDPEGQPFDYVILEANKALIQQSGLVNAIGKTMKSLAPDHEQFWYDIYGQVALTGEPMRFEHEAAALDRYYDVYAFRIGLPGQNQVAVLFNDILERKQREANATFLNQISKDLSLLSKPDEIIQMVGVRLGTFLQASTCILADVDEDKNEATIHHGWNSEDVPSLKQTFRLGDYFGEAFLQAGRAGETVVVYDTARDERANAEAYARLKLGAFVTVPFQQYGRWTANITVTSREPRLWRTEEISLLQEIASRVFPRIERTRAEQALQESEKRLRLTIEATELATWEWNLETNEVYWNEQHFRLLGIKPYPNPVDPEEFFRHVHPNERERLRDLLKQTISERKVYDTEFCALLEDGSQRWMSGYGSITEERNGQPIRLSGVMFDIDERRRAQESLYQSESRLRAILESAKDYAIYTTDLDRHITSWNRGAEVVFGYEGEEIMNRLCDQLYSPEDRQQGIPLYESQKAIHEGRAENERWHIRQDGSRFYGSGVVTPLRNEAGQIVGLLKVMRDLTIQKRAEDSLKEADQRKNEFLAMLAHELRNPMATLSNGLQILSITAATNAQAKTLIDRMTLQTNHLVRMVDDLLDVSRISQGKIEIKKEVVYLKELVRQATESAQVIIDEKQQELRINVPQKAIQMQGDATRLVQMIINLLTNASRYTPAGGTIELSLEQKGDKAIIRVSDTGIGLAGDQLSKIFELFVQVDHSLGRSEGGLGLGLTLVKQIVELHNGSVEAESKGLSQGSTFIVRLPVLSSTSDEKETSVEASSSSSLAKVLIVDDNPDSSLTMSMLLELKGYKVHSCNSGFAALEVIESISPDVILLDIGMPEMDGYETCRLIRKQAEGAKAFIIAVSGYGQESDKQKAREAGFDNHVTKPVRLEALLEIINHH